jgi:signal transduction histidine kinase
LNKKIYIFTFIIYLLASTINIFLLYDNKNSEIRTFNSYPQKVKYDKNIISSTLKYGNKNNLNLYVYLVDNNNFVNINDFRTSNKPSFIGDDFDTVKKIYYLNELHYIIKISTQHNQSLYILLLPNNNIETLFYATEIIITIIFFTLLFILVKRKNYLKKISLLKNIEIEKEIIIALSHEIKTPLAVIQGYLDLLQESKNINDLSSYLTIMQSNLSRLEQAVGDILAQSIKNSNEKNYFLVDIIGNKILQYYEYLEGREITFNSNSLLKIENKLFIDLILSNILSNFIRHTPTDSKLTINLYDVNSSSKLTIIQNSNGDIQKKEGIGIGIIRKLCDFESIDLTLEHPYCYYFTFR